MIASDRRAAVVIAAMTAGLSLAACSSTPATPSTGDGLFDKCYHALLTRDAGAQPPASAQVTAVWECTPTTAAPDAPVMFLKATGDFSQLAHQLLTYHPAPADPSPSECAANEGLPQQFLVRTSEPADYTLTQADPGSCAGGRPRIEWMIAANFQVQAQYTPTPSPS